jgi:S-(hydroxymethyl)glutathione dehydrogenase/alcohol dehydrogenase
MQAAVLWAGGEPITIAEIDEPALDAHDVRIEVQASGVCHSDITTSRLPTPKPAIMGHEGAGVVVELGREVSRVAVGDRVIASYVPSCGNCFYCVRGEATQCVRSADLINSHRGTVNGQPVLAKGGLGTWSQRMTVSELQVVPVKTDLPSEQLALIGCGVTTGAGAALWSAKVQPGSTVAVYGCGGVGMFTIQGARIAGAARIFVVDPLESKRNAAVKVGATDLIDPADGDPVEQIKALTEGRGTDYAFEVVGRPDTIMQTYNTVRPRGTAVVVGMPQPDAAITLPVGTMFRFERRFMGSFCGSAQAQRDMPILVQLAESGKLDIGAAVSQYVKLEQAPDALAALDAGEVFRSVILPN